MNPTLSCAVPHGDYVYYFGGQNADEINPLMWRLHVRLQSWEPVGKGVAVADCGIVKQKNGIVTIVLGQGGRWCTQQNRTDF